MFFPKAMTEIELVVPARDLLTVTKLLHGHGVFHQADSGYPGGGSDSDSANTWQEKAAAYTALERRIQPIMQALTLDEGQPPSSSSEGMVDVEVVRPVLEQIEDEVKQTSNHLADQRKQLEQLEGNLRQLQPIDDVEVDIGALRNSRYLFWMLGVIPASNVERLQTSLTRV